jgi:hypothetical protein
MNRIGDQFRDTRQSNLDNRERIAIHGYSTPPIPALSHFLTSLLFHPVASTLLGRVTLCLIQRTFIYRTGPEPRWNVWTFVYRTANPDKWSCIYAAVDRRVQTPRTPSRLSNKSRNPLSIAARKGDLPLVVHRARG